MSVSRTFTTSVSGGSEAISKSKTVTGEIAIEMNYSIPDSTSDEAFACAFEYDKLQGLYMVADQNLTVKASTALDPINSNATVGNATIDLTANVPFVWYSGCGLANIFDSDVAALGVSNSSGSAATLQVQIIATN